MTQEEQRKKEVCDSQEEQRKKKVCDSQEGLDVEAAVSHLAHHVIPAAGISALAPASRPPSSGGTAPRPPAAPPSGPWGVLRVGGQLAQALGDGGVVAQGAQWSHVTQQGLLQALLP